MALEESGLPSIAVHTDVFARLARVSALANGMPRARQAFVPQPVVDRTPAQLRSYIEGIDPVSKRPFMQELIEGLTGDLSDEDLKGVSFDRSTPRLLPPDTEDNLQQLFAANHWTDYLPIVLPTEERVAAMMKGTSHPSDEIVGRNAADLIPRVLGIYGREGCSERRHGGSSPRIFSGDTGAGGERINRQIQQHDLDDQHGGGQRADPP